MTERPSEDCGDCIWWYEDPFLCEGCPSNPDSGRKGEAEDPWNEN